MREGSSKVKRRSKEKQEAWRKRAVAAARLHRWGRIKRLLSDSGAPNANYYSKQPFTIRRIDNESAIQMMASEQRMNEAIETDNWLMELGEKHPAAYRAMVIRYVYVEPGGDRHCLSGVDQIRRWKKETGLGRTRFFWFVNIAETRIQTLMGEAVGS